jgi:PAS domain S-box-containing protein
MARILVVDDHPANRQLLVTILGYAGHRMLEAGDGAEALDILATAQVDLVISDILMPTMDGVAFVRHLRTDPKGAGIPVIFHTASYRQAEAQVLAESCGVARVVLKPCRPQDLLDAVHAELGIPRFEAPARTTEPQQAPSQKAGTPWPGGRNSLAGILSACLETTPEQTLTRLENVSLRLATLLEWGMEAAEQRDSATLLSMFCRIARDLVTAKYAALGILEEDGWQVRHFITQGIASARFGALPSRGSFLERLLKEGRPVRVTTFGEPPSVWGLPKGFPPFKSLLAVPVVSRLANYGWIYLMDHLGLGPFSSEDEGLTSTLAAQVALAYENLRLLESVQAEIQRRVQSEGTQASLMAILEAAEDAIISVDMKSRITDWNRGAERILLYRPEEILGRPYALIIPPEAMPDHEELVRTIISGSKPPVRESARVRKDGAKVLVAAYSAPLRDTRGRLIGINTVLRDLTASRQMEAALLETATQLQNVFNSIDEVVWSFDPNENRLLTLSPACERVFGHPAEAFFSDPGLWASLIQPGGQPERLSHPLTQDAPAEWEHQIRCPDGQTRWLRSRSTPVLDDSGKLLRIDGISGDITEHQLAEEALRQSEALFRSLVESLDDLVCTLSPDLRLTGLFGRKAEALRSRIKEWSGKPLDQLLPSETGRTMSALCARILEEGPLELQQVDFQGRFYRISAAPITSGAWAPHGIIAVAHDCTEFLQLQERLAQQERLAFLGSLVGSVAHDVRSPLAAIRTTLDLLEIGTTFAPDSQEMLVHLAKNVDLISALMGELLDYANPRPLDLRPCPMPSLVEEVAQEFRTVADQQVIQVETRFEEEPRILVVDASRTRQVLKNLIENAIQHSPKGGRVLIHGRHDPDRGGSWLLTVEDRGPGIGPADLPRIFDPFFTRRAGGTGLGLAICLRIAQQHGWDLRAVNRLEGGMIFSIHFPLPSSN